MEAIISAEYRKDIEAVEADPIAQEMAKEIPADIEPDFLLCLQEYRRRGGIHGTTHMGAVAQAIRNLRKTA